MLNEYNKKEAAKTRWGMQRVNLLRNLLKSMREIVQHWQLQLQLLLLLLLHTFK